MAKLSKSLETDREVESGWVLGVDASKGGSFEFGSSYLAAKL